jgi:hypothetical protein
LTTATFGASDGEPRQEIDPWQQIRDYQDAIIWASDLSEVDAERIVQRLRTHPGRWKGNLAYALRL